MTSKSSPARRAATDWLKQRPIAHRGLHDETAGIFENTLSAVAAAMRREYAIEVDLQPASDGVPMVFHDYQLERMTGAKGGIRDTPASVLNGLKIAGTSSTVPTLSNLLELVDGGVGLVLELKGLVGADDGFVSAVADALKDYQGNVAIMSFYDHILEDARRIAPHITLGLTAAGDESKYETHRLIAEKTNVEFISYEFENLNTRFVWEFRKTGKPVISWTVKSEAEAELSARFADQPTFEGFLP